MALEADWLRLLNNLILNHYSMHLEIGRTKKELLGHYGFLE